MGYTLENESYFQKLITLGNKGRTCTCMDFMRLVLLIFCRDTADCFELSHINQHGSSYRRSNNLENNRKITGRRNRRLSTKPVAGIVMIFTSAKLKEDFMTERLSTSKLSLKLVTPPLLLSVRFPLVTTSNGIISVEILASGQCDLQCKIKETLLIRDLKPALNENVGSENLLLY